MVQIQYDKTPINDKINIVIETSVLVNQYKI